MVWPIVTLIALSGITLRAAGPPDDWNAVERVAPGTRVEANWKDRGKPGVKGTLVRASAESLAVRTKSGEVLLPVAEVERVKVAAPERRMRNGLIGLAAGAGAGLGVGWAVCPYCPNEGHSGFGGAGAAIGAGVGALAFLPAPYREIYRAPRK